MTTPARTRLDPHVKAAQALDIATRRRDTLAARLAKHRAAIAEVEAAHTLAAREVEHLATSPYLVQSNGPGEGFTVGMDTETAAAASAVPLLPAHPPGPVGPGSFA